jgi:hypothetical protein
MYITALLVTSTYVRELQRGENIAHFIIIRLSNLTIVRSTSSFSSS